MKRIYFTILSAAVAFAFAACQKDTTETADIQPAGGETTGETITVVASLSEQTKTQFDDANGIRWQAGDRLRWVGTENGGPAEATLKAENLSADGFMGNFELNIPRTDAAAAVKGYFTYNGHPDNNNEFEFTKRNSANAARTQSEAGVMNTEYLFLHSGVPGLVTIPAGVDTYELKMDIVGTIFRVLPYTTQYNDESIKSVTMMSNSDIVGTVAYDNRETGEYRSPMYQNSKEVSVTLDTPFSLNGVTDRSKSKGIYIAVPATAKDKPLDGYCFIVYTDKAEYIYYAMNEKLVVGENKVVNMFLDLAKCTKRVGYDDVKGELHYVGDLGAADNTVFAPQARTGFDGGYWYAQVKGGDYADWTTREAGDAPQFYKDVTFTVTDDATNAPADWLKVYYMTNSTHWGLDMTENTSSATRTATVTATFGDVDGYVVPIENMTKTITVTQLGVVEIIPMIKYEGATEFSKDGASITAKVSLNVGGNVLSDAEANNYMSQIKISAENAYVRRDGVTLNIDIAPNMHTAVKNIVIKVEAPNGTDELRLTQAAGDSNAPAPIFTYTFGDWQNGNSSISPTYGKEWESGKDDDWMAVIFNVKKDGVAPDALTPEDEKALVKQILGWSDEQYDNTFLTFRIEYSKGETKILFRVKTNGTGAERVEEGYVWAYDYSYYISRFRVTQRAQ